MYRSAYRNDALFRAETRAIRRRPLRTLPAVTKWRKRGGKVGGRPNPVRSSRQLELSPAA